MSTAGEKADVRTALRAKEEELLELIRRIATGDQAAIARFYDLTNRQVYGLVRHIISDAGITEEVVLEVFVQVWQQAANYDLRRGAPTAWLLMMARSRAIDRLRSGRYEREMKDDIEKFFDLAADQASPEESAAEAERRHLVQNALTTLPKEQLQVISLAYYSGLSHSEISEKLSQPLGTVKTRIRLAMRHLRDVLRPLLEGGD